MTEFSNRLKELRTGRGMSQEQLAERIDVSRQVITKWENGSGAPKIENLIALAKFFGITVDSLLGREDVSGETAEVSSDLKLLMLRLEEQLRAECRERDDPFWRLLSAAASYFDIEKTELLLSAGRNRIVRAQLELIYMLNDMGCSTKIITEKLGSTSSDLVRIYLDKAREEYRTDETFRQDIMHIKAMAGKDRRNEQDKIKEGET